MGRLKKRLSKKRGLAPGTLVHIGHEIKADIDIYQFEYDGNFISENKIDSVDDISVVDDGHVHWLNVNGVANTKLVEAIGKKFNIHHLLLEDIVNTAQRPKVDEFPEYLYLVIKMLSCPPGRLSIGEEQISMLLIRNWVITFQERPGDVFDPVRNRIRQSLGKIRSNDSSYLFYAILDCIIDNYFYVVEAVEEKIEALNDIVSTRPDKQVLQQIHEIKREVVFLRRVTWPIRDLMSNLLKNDAELISLNVMPYLRDVDDHVKRIVDAVNDSRESVSSLFDLYSSTVGNSMNQVMKVLTIMSAIFIPMTFIAGIYGMNFENMPELKFANGYYYALSAMFGIGVAMLTVFKIKKWW